VVVLPFVSGGGIKNKLLEAAAMGKAIVASRRATLGLKGLPPLAIATTPGSWVESILRLWDEPSLRADVERRLRHWVVQQHTWAAAADIALAGMTDSISNRSTESRTRRTS
jgi:hypothetical protein